MKASVLRVVTVSVFVILVLTGLLFNTGFGTLSSFGIGAISEICPVGALESLLASKTLVPRVLIGLFVFFLVCLVLGRVFCGWLCPVPWLRKGAGTEPMPPLKETEKQTGSITYFQKGRLRTGSGAHQSEKIENQEGQSLQTQPQAKHKESEAGFAQTSCNGGSVSAVPKTPFVILGAALLSALAFGFPVFCIICPVGLTFALIIGIWGMIAFNEPSITIALIAGFLLIEILFLRKWCHSFCPIGAVILLFSYFNRFFRPSVDSGCLKRSKGHNCTRCRDVCPEGIDLNTKISPMLLARCTKCHACSEACPVQTIHFPLLAKKTEETAKTGGPKPAVEIKQRVAAEAVKDFEPVILPLTKKEVVYEAERCISCGACEAVCPQHSPIREMMDFIRQEKFLKAGKVLLKAGAMSEICGRVCPQDRLCQGACPLAKEGGAVRIGALTGFCADYVLSRGLKTQTLGKAKGRAAVVGAGPAGLACADVLRRKGLEVVVFDKHEKAGGLLYYGIPSFKLPKDVVERRLAIYQKEGVRFELRRAIETEEEIEALIRDHDVVLWAAGAVEPVRPKIPGVEEAGFYTSDVFLGKVNVSPDSGKTEFEIEGREVAVLGAGDSAMDCARCAVRLGAKHVFCIARKPRGTISASGKELRLAESEGVELLDSTQVVEIVRDASGRITGVQTLDCLENKKIIPAQIVISAWGFRSKPIPGLEKFVKFNSDGTIKTDSSMRTGDKIFAAGDAVLGADLVTDAIAQGRFAAEKMFEFVSSKQKNR